MNRCVHPCGTIVFIALTFSPIKLAVISFVTIFPSFSYLQLLEQSLNTEFKIPTEMNTRRSGRQNKKRNTDVRGGESGTQASRTRPMKKARTEDPVDSQGSTETADFTGNKRARMEEFNTNCVDNVNAFGRGIREEDEDEGLTDKSNKATDDEIEKEALQNAPRNHGHNDTTGEH